MDGRHRNKKDSDYVGARNDLICRYRIDAEKRGHTYELSLEEFISLTKGNCYYCGSEPKQLHRRTRSKCAAQADSPSSLSKRGNMDNIRKVARWIMILICYSGLINFIILAGTITKNPPLFYTGVAFLILSFYIIIRS